MTEISLPQLCQLRNYPAIAKVCEQRFGVPVNERALAEQSEWVMRSHKKGFGWCWGECTWFMFLKNRMCEIGCFTNGCQLAIEGGTTAVMHVFFLNIEETPAMLSRLRNEKPDQVEIARTKLSKETAAFVEPINGTAAKVVH